MCVYFNSFKSEILLSDNKYLFFFFNKTSALLQQLNVNMDA